MEYACVNFYQIFINLFEYSLKRLITSIDSSVIFVRMNLFEYRSQNLHNDQCSKSTIPSLRKESH